MSRNTYSEPRLFIGNKEIINFQNIKYKNSGGNRVSSLNIVLTDPEIGDAALLGEEVVFYLNYGSIDSVPFFRGFIKEYTPTDTKVTVIAHDVLMYLAGKDAPPLVITDDSNYDGFTLSQMLQDYIERVVNKNKTRIGLDMLNDTNPPVSLSGYRGKSVHPLKIIQSKIPKKVSSLSDIKSYRLIVRDDGIKSNICFVEEQDIDSGGVVFTVNDGIEKVKYKKRPDPNYYTQVVGNNVMEYQHNSLPIGITMGKLSKKKYDYPDEAREDAFLEATVAEEKKEITLSVNKGHYLELGNVITIHTPEYPELIGKHRIMSKDVSVSTSGMKCNLKVSRESAFASDYLEVAL